MNHNVKHKMEEKGKETFPEDKKKNDLCKKDLSFLDGSGIPGRFVDSWTATGYMFGFGLFVKCCT